MANPKIPPQNIEAESSLIGSILLDSESLLRITDIVATDDFYDPRHRHIFSVIMNLFEKTRPIHVMTVSSILKYQTPLTKFGDSIYTT